MTETIRIFVNAVPIDVPVGTNVRSAVQAADLDLAAHVASGTASVMDGRGIPLAPDARLTAGAILRVVVSARRRADGAGDEAVG